jgi:hypothetical protein
VKNYQFKVTNIDDSTQGSKPHTYWRTWTAENEEVARRQLLQSYYEDLPSVRVLKIERVEKGGK